MVNITIILLGIIFFLFILIIIVYFVYYNRKINPTAVITDNGISMTSVSFTQLLITDGSIAIPIPDPGFQGIANIMSLQIASGNLSSGSQGWILLDNNQKEITAFSEVIPSSSEGVTVKSGDLVYLRNAYTAGYVSYSVTDPNIYSDNLEITQATPFTIEFDVVSQILALKSTLNTSQYLIPYNVKGSGVFLTGGIIMGIPNDTYSKNWYINRKP